MFDSRPQEEKAKMLAFRLANNLVEAWNYEQMEKQTQSETPARGGR